MQDGIEKAAKSGAEVYSSRSRLRPAIHVSRRLFASQARDEQSNDVGDIYYVS